MKYADPIGTRSQHHIACNETMMIEAIPTEQIYQRERELFITAKASMPSIGISDIDVLVVEEIGKDISGIGSIRTDLEGN